MWLEIEKNPRLYDEVVRQLVQVALDAYNGMAASDRIVDRMGVVEHEIIFRKHVRRLLDTMQSSALTWIQDSFGDWRIMESTVGRLWALEDADKRQRSAVRKAAMMQLILRMMGVGLKSEMEAVVRRWSLMKGQAYWSGRRVQRMFLARYEYWRRKRTDTMIMDEEVVQGQRILTDMRIRNELVDRLSRVTAQRQLQRWMDEPLVLECNACGCEGEADNGEICSEDLCIICCCRLGCECRVQPARCRSSDEAAGGEDDEEWMQTGGAEAMGLARSKDDDRAVVYMKGNRLKEELAAGWKRRELLFQIIGSRGWLGRRETQRDA